MNEIRKYVALIENATKPKKPLIEGIKFGAKEKSIIDANQDDYRIGIEYEFHPNDEDLYYSVNQSVQDGNTIEDLTTAREIEEHSIDGDDDPINEQSSDWQNGIVEVNGEHDYYINFENSMVILKSYDPYIDDAIESMIIEIIDSHFEIDGGGVISELSSFLKFIFDTCNTIINEEAKEDEYQLSIDGLGDKRYYLSEIFVEKVYDYYNSNITNKDTITALNDTDNIANKSLLSVMYDDNKKLEEISSIIEKLDEAFTIMDKGEKPDYDFLISLFDDIKANSNRRNLDSSVYHLLDPTDRMYTDYFDYYRVYTDINETSDIHDILDNRNISYSRVETDNDMQIEVITGELTLSEAKISMTDMFELIDDLGYTSDVSGMHISVSTKRWDLDDINITKLLVLMNIGYIHGKLFDERVHVSDLNSIVSNDIKKKFNSILSSGILDKNIGVINSFNAIERIIDLEKISRYKMQSINLGDYDRFDGRIELRYFGGKDYHKRYYEIVHELYRTLNMLDIAYGDTHNQIYEKAKYKYLDERITEALGMSFSTLVKIYKRIKDDVRNNNTEKGSFAYIAMNNGTKYPSIPEIKNPAIPKQILSYLS